MRNAAGRLEIRILAMDEELFLVIMGLRTKHPITPGLIPLFLSSSIIPELIPLYPGSGAAAFEILILFSRVKAIFPLRAVNCTHPK